MAVADTPAPQRHSNPHPAPPPPSTPPLKPSRLPPPLRPPSLTPTKHPDTPAPPPPPSPSPPARPSPRFRKLRQSLAAARNPTSNVPTPRTETANATTTTASSNGPSHDPSIEAALLRASDAANKKPKVNLSALAASVLSRPRHHDQHTTVRYIAQTDLADHMVKRSKVGPSSSVYVLLEGTNLSVSKSKTASARYRLNVRVTPVSVDVDTRELRIYVPANGKTKLLRLVMENTEVAGRWKTAVENALKSDITEYYTFGKTLGSGAYGDVVKAVHNVTKETRAVKIIKRGDNTKSKEHLDQEIQVMKSISHENIVQTYQIFDLRRTIYIVMEYVSGGDLFDFVAQHDCLTERHSSETMRSIFRAVEYLHLNSIVHRDLKPENILCANDTWPLQIKVSDFGFANFLDPRENADDTMRTQVGTVYFMAPEIITNKGHGPAVDMWACGVILYTILTGRLPFPGRNTTEYLTNVVRGKILFPPVLWKGISKAAQSLVKGLLNLDPNIRLNAIGALNHRWIQWPDAQYGDNKIRRDRSNLHSKQRRLFKARKAIIAVAMANKFKATIPQVVESMGDSTKKVAASIESGVKNMGEGLAEGTKNIGENTKKVAASMAGGTKKVAEGIGTGVKKTVDGVENGARKVGQGVKKTADGIETGFKKTADGVENSARKVGQGVKKTADGFGQGVKKTADGIGQGVKKTADGLERGVKGTGHKLKRGVGRIRQDRGKDTEDSQSQVNSDSTSSRRGHLPFRRRNPSFSAVSGSDSEAGGAGMEGNGVAGGDGDEVEQKEGGISAALGPGGEPRGSPAPMVKSWARRGGKKKRFGRERKQGSVRETSIQDGGGSGDRPTENLGGPVVRAERDIDVDSAGEYESALEEHSETEEGWQRHNRHDKDEDDFMRGGGSSSGGAAMMQGVPRNQFVPSPAGFLGEEVMNGTAGLEKKKPPGFGRPTLPPLSGLPMGLSDESDTPRKSGIGISGFDFSVTDGGTSTVNGSGGGGGRPTLVPLSGLPMGLSDEAMERIGFSDGKGVGGGGGGGGRPNLKLLSGLPTGLSDEAMQNIINEDGAERPNLPPLSGLTSGLSDDAMGGSSGRDYGGANVGSPVVGTTSSSADADADGEEADVDAEDGDMGMGFGLGDMGLGPAAGGAGGGGMNNRQVDLMRKTTQLMLGGKW